ncbi:hypothetical protein [Mycobacterium sp. SMC-4]|uniref:hypothetical protein n=1 Tax=Mycobacterium sp. SMC-4 TaxID=2857059 RepID=UPI0021B45C0B|nr:hypothetical protein [Mycobacterium sp. SMC-4]UXA16409.1 hypothetical protein KXD98_16450 [Mycobacterium sp. SMC-4]
MNRRAPTIAGVAFAVLYTTAVLILPAVAGSEPAAVRARALLLAFAALALGLLAAAVRDRLTGPPAHLFTIGSILLLAQLCIGTWLSAGPAIRPGQVTDGTAATLDDIGSLWLPTATIAHILVAIPILLEANAGRLPRWLGIGAAVFVVEQLIETITIIGPPGSFISPGGPMNIYLGATLSAAFFAALGIAVGQLPDTVGQQDDTASEEPVGD